MSPRFNPPSLIKDTRTRTSKYGTGGDRGGIVGGGGGSSILPGGYGSYGGAASGMASLWSPYARPPRRSKRLVLLWVGTLLAVGLFTWYMSTRRGGELARSYADLVSKAPQKEPIAAGGE